MPDSTEEKRKQSTPCVTSQQELIRDLVESIVSSKLLSIKLGELDQKVDHHDRKHTQAIEDLRTDFNTQNVAVTGKLDLLISDLKPYMENANKLKSKVNKWSPILVIMLAGYIIFGDKTLSILKFVVKLAGA